MPSSMADFSNAACFGGVADSLAEVAAPLVPTPPHARSGFNCSTFYPVAFTVVITVREIERDTWPPRVPTTVANNSVSVTRFLPRVVAISAPDDLGASAVAVAICTAPVTASVGIIASAVTAVRAIVIATALDFAVRTARAITSCVALNFHVCSATTLRRLG